MGAKHVPYEIGHDALDKWVAWLQAAIPERQVILAEWLASPPETLEHREYDAYKRLRPGYPRTLTRPEGFDPHARRGSYNPGREAYEMLYDRTRSGHRTAIEQMTETLAYATARRAAWRPQ
jgi:hypothetical protein